MNELLHGVYDLHFHTAPDVTPRKCSDLEHAARLRAAGMAGGVIKNHYLDTAGRAVGCGSVILTTDFGQPESPYSDEGMLAYMQALLSRGYTPDELDLMTRVNPKRLISK